MQHFSNIMSSVLITLFSIFMVHFFTVHGQQCNSNGFYCFNITHVQFCPVGSTVPLGTPQKCGGNVLCGQNCALPCVAENDPCIQFSCPSEGLFANPYNCSMFYNCVIVKYLDNGRVVVVVVVEVVVVVVVVVEEVVVGVVVVVVVVVEEEEEEEEEEEVVVGVVVVVVVVVGVVVVVVVIVVEVLVGVY
ncbi:Protein of unknown function [Gryllus bimaculatus]|nr:Protein of unknown function [Gryllus bimaculatus]